MTRLKASTPRKYCDAEAVNNEMANAMTNDIILALKNIISERRFGQV